MSEQALPAPGRQSVTDALIAFLRERQAKGIATYGRSLETFNGRDSVQDLLEELIDGAQYAMQWKLERAALLADLAAANARAKAAEALNLAGLETLTDQALYSVQDASRDLEGRGDTRSHVYCLLSHAGACLLGALTEIRKTKSERGG